MTARVIQGVREIAVIKKQPNHLNFFAKYFALLHLEGGAGIDGNT